MIPSAERAVAIVGLGAILARCTQRAGLLAKHPEQALQHHERPPERWTIADYYDPDPAAPDKTYSKIGAWVRGFQFDWKRYRVPPKVAAAMDESQQWAVTIAAEALADYGYPDRPLDTERTGVIMGTAMGGEMHYITHPASVFPEYRPRAGRGTRVRRLPATGARDILSAWQATLDDRIPPSPKTPCRASCANIVSGRVANVFNLRGPNFITDAACASSFAAIKPRSSCSPRARSTPSSPAAWTATSASAPSSSSAGSAR